ncbi:MAG TPA: ABC transporter permease subunit [Candidatus Binatia bacterium]|jgi:hypothetical protein|nr:ABC transporter permease subunit [Candidatus Binatia bacterium]
MNCLPIVGRELRVAARKRSTFWLRVAAAVTGLLLGSGCLALSSAQGTSTAQMGSVLFYVLTWTCLVASLSAGLFFTSDSLSEEKREGTLGLLFLTELRGYDVALGKLLATSLRGFYALLAVLPIVAITQLMGGITGAQYWRSSLALVNALFFSLAAGMFISALSRDSQKALAGTLFVMLLLALGGPVADGIIAGVKKRGFLPVWSLSSPAYVFTAAGVWGRSPYWKAFALTQLLGWAMLALACGLVPHTWQERKGAGARTSRGWAYSWKYGGARRRQRLRRRLLERRPLAWLACRERWQSLGLWAVAILIAGGFVTGLLLRPHQGVWIFWNYVGGLFVLILYLWAASQACRFLVEARRSGLLELLLVAPVTEKEIVGGQWRALVRMFGLPVLLLLSAHVAAATLSQLSFQRIAAQTATVTTAAMTNQSGTISNQAYATSFTVSVGPGTNSARAGTNAAVARPGFRVASTAQQAGMAAAGAAAAGLSSGGNLLALGWFGMWMGLTSRSANLATLKTILFVQVIPWFVIAFGSTMVLGIVMARLFSGSTQPTMWFAWWPLLSGALGATAALAKDIGFIAWSRKKLLLSLREQAGRDLGHPRFAAPLPLPAPPPIPPVITVPN